MSVWVRIALLMTLAAVLTGCSGSPAATAAPTATLRAITGVITVNGSTLGTVCSPKPGYDDIHEGTQVTLKDGAGTIIGTSALGPVAIGGRQACDYAFTIAGVPEVPFYAIEVGHRGEVTASLAEMQASGWRFELELGLQ